MSFGLPPAAKTHTQYVEVAGVLDLVTQAIKTPPGVSIDAGNFVPDINGGARRVGGYERFDGRAAPSDAVYSVIAVTGLGSVSVGDNVVGASSGATAVVVAAPGGGVIVCTRVDGTFTVGESMTVSAVPVGSFASSSDGSADTLTLDVEYNNLAADSYRSLISAVPGSGSVLGVHMFNGVVYAWRNNAGGTAAVMYKSSSSGWTAVAGVPALAPSGSFQCLTHNFSGGAGTDKMYGCDGANKAFQFDGATFTQITSTAVPDTPSAIAVHKNRLFLANLGSLFLSSPGDPVSGWVGVGTTPAEIGTGDYITDLLPMTGSSDTGALAIFGRNRTSILYGSSQSSWQLSLLSTSAGAAPRTAQYLGTGLSLDSVGVTNIKAVQDFGNFAASSVSTGVQPFITTQTGLATASSLLKSQNQYRVYFSDGFGLAFRVEGGVKGVMPIYYPNPVTCCFSGEDEDGAEVVFFGSDNGMVYQAEVGTSFDGEPIEAWLRLAFNAPAGPSTKVSWRRVRIDMDVPEYAEVEVSYEHDYGDEDRGASIVRSRTINGGGGFWDGPLNWDGFVWDSPYKAPPTFKLDGSSPNLSLLIYSSSEVSRPFAVQSLIYHYTPRRLDRRVA